MDPLLAALLGALLGAAVAGLVAWIRRRRRETVVEIDESPPRPVRELVGVLPTAAVVVGPQDDILVHNEAALAEGVVRGNRLGISALLELVREVRATGEPAAATLELARPGRATRRLAASVLRLDERTVFVVAQDRAPGLRVEEAARDFLANATHELKTPIGAISLMAEAVEDAADDEEAVRRFGGRIQREAGRLAQLVGQIIELSRIQGDSLRVPRAVGVDGLVGHVLSVNRDAAAQKQVSLATGGIPGLTVLGDEVQLTTALSNLVRNAIAYSDPKARVVVTTRPEGDDAVAISVSDNGIGIHGEDVDRIFERFYRVDYARSRENGGSGLGLSIVDEIVQASGGTIRVWSKPGSGSTFTLTLPAPPTTEESA